VIQLPLWSWGLGSRERVRQGAEWYQQDFFGLCPYTQVQLEKWVHLMGVIWSRRNRRKKGNPYAQKTFLKAVGREGLRAGVPEPHHWQSSLLPTRGEECWVSTWLKGQRTRVYSLPVGANPSWWITSQKSWLLEPGEVLGTGIKSQPEFWRRHHD
jgi:hypothetical protein